MTKIKLGVDIWAYFKFGNKYGDYYTHNIHASGNELGLVDVFLIPKDCQGITRRAYETFKRRMRLK